MWQGSDKTAYIFYNMNVKKCTVFVKISVFCRNGFSNRLFGDIICTITQRVKGQYDDKERKYTKYCYYRSR